MSKSPHVSVVMPVYNGERYLRQSVESILNQTWRDFEFIIVDDGSIDTTLQILREYNDERIVLLRHSTNLGVAESRNRGIAQARGQYIACMDADDIAFPQRLELQVRFLEQNPQIVLVGGATTMIDEKGAPAETIRFPCDSREIEDLLIHSNCFAQSTVMMRTEAFRSLGGYRFPLAEDYDLWLRMAERYELANLPEPVLFYRVHSDQISSQQLKKLTTSALGVQVSARVRRQLGYDPTLGMKEMTAEVLHQLGVTYTDIQKAFIDGFLGALQLLLKTDPGAGLRTINETRSILRAESVSSALTKDVAQKVLGLAYHFYYHERYVISKELLKLSVGLDPRLLGNMRTIRIAAKLILGESRTDVIRKCKRLFTQSELSVS